MYMLVWMIVLTVVLLYLIIQVALYRRALVVVLQRELQTLSTIQKIKLVLKYQEDIDLDQINVSTQQGAPGQTQGDTNELSASQS